MKRRVAFLANCIYDCAFLEQVRAELSVSVLRGIEERSVAEVVDSVYIFREDSGR